MDRTEQLQIRVTPAEKAALKRLARRAGQAVSAYVLARALPQAQHEFETLVESLVNDSDRRFALAALNDLLASLSGSELLDAANDRAPTNALSPYWRNYVAAMVEQAAHRKGVSAPAWLQEIEPLEEPHFVAPLEGLRLHLLRSSPVPFRRRNIFVDAGVGERV